MHSTVVLGYWCPNTAQQRNNAQYGGPGVLAFFTRPTSLQDPCMTRFAERTRPRGACSKTASDERRRTIQCTPTTPDTHPPRSISTRSPAFTPSQQSNGIFAYAARPPAASLHAHARCSSRSPLARPLPCVDRTIGERNLTTPRGLLAQLVELTTHCSDCAKLSHHILPPRPGA